MCDLFQQIRCGGGFLCVWRERACTSHTQEWEFTSHECEMKIFIRILCSDVVYARVCVFLLHSRLLLFLIFNCFFSQKILTALVPLGSAHMEQRLECYMEFNIMMIRYAATAIVAAAVAVAATRHISPIHSLAGAGSLLRSLLGYVARVSQLLCISSPHWIKNVYLIVVHLVTLSLQPKADASPHRVRLSHIN